MSLLIAVSGWDEAPWIERFRALLPEHRIVTLGEPFDRREVHYVAAWKPPHGALAGLPNLAAIFSLGAGVDHLLNDPRLPDVPIARVVDADLTQRMSEYIMLHCLMHLRQQRLYDHQQREKIWQPDYSQAAARDIRIGIMGMGVMGQDAALKLNQLGFNVAGWSRTPKNFDNIQSFSGSEQLDVFLARTDILICLLPLTDATRGMINRPLLQKLARNGRLSGPILINAARGGVHVEADIISCLQDGTLKAATLDVFEVEPLPSDSPLWTMANVTLTPHNAAMSDPDFVAAQIVQNILRLEAGEDLLHQVDRGVGY
jgi:glyoxylate/hydroxypyruvate reductase